MCRLCSLIFSSLLYVIFEWVICHYRAKSFSCALLCYTTLFSPPVREALWALAQFNLRLILKPPIRGRTDLCEQLPSGCTWPQHTAKQPVERVWGKVPDSPHPVLQASPSPVLHLLVGRAFFHLRFKKCFKKKENKREHPSTPRRRNLAGALRSFMAPEVKVGGMKLTAWHKKELHCAGKWDWWTYMGQRWRSMQSMWCQQLVSRSCTVVWFMQIFPPGRPEGSSTPTLRGSSTVIRVQPVLP